jgi:hypothetical protein
MAAFAKTGGGNERASRDQDALDSRGHLCERLPAGVRDPHAHNVGLSTGRDHALALRGCESGRDQFDHHVDREPVRTQDPSWCSRNGSRQAIRGRGGGQDWDGDSGVRSASVHSHDYRPDPPRARDGPGFVTRRSCRARDDQLTNAALAAWFGTRPDTKSERKPRHLCRGFKDNTEGCLLEGSLFSSRRAQAISIMQG